MTAAPRHTSGAKYHHIEGREVYAVMLNERGDEISDRHPGELWVAFVGGNIDIIFRDEAGSRSSTFDLTGGGTAVQCALIVDGDTVTATPIGRSVRFGDQAQMDWGNMYDRMA